MPDDALKGASVSREQELSSHYTINVSTMAGSMWKSSGTQVQLHVNFLVINQLNAQNLVL